MKYPVKLGRKMPGMPVPMMEPPESSEDMMHYPTLYLEWKKPYDLPDEGEITLRFKKVRETKDTREGRESYTAELDIHEIIDVECECELEDARDSSEKALDKMADEAGDD